MTSANTAKDAAALQRKGLWLGFIGIAIFSVTLPMTRLAVGSVESPGMSGVFIAMGRAVVAAALSILFLVLTRAPLPRRADAFALGMTTLGVVLGFPLLTSIALRYVEAVHASVLVGILPLATAMVGAWLHRQRPSAGFWLCAGLGSVLVAAFALLRMPGGFSGGLQGLRLDLQWADLLLLGAMLCAAVGYGYGGLLSQGAMRAEQVICWALVIALPVTLPVALFYFPTAPVRPAAWWAFAYLAVFSMWLGFFAWYRGLAWGGTVRVSQVQLVQPFLSMLIAVPLLGERLDAVTLGFGLAVVLTVFVGKKMPVR